VGSGSVRKIWPNDQGLVKIPGVGFARHVIGYRAVPVIRQGAALSYDINFWKLERPLIIAPVDIYRRLCKGEHVDGLAALPVSEICGQIQTTFPAFDPAKGFSTFRIAGGSIEASWSEQHFRFDLRGDWNSEAQSIVEIMAAFHCPLFDPQVNERYDANGGMTFRESPSFVKPRSSAKFAEVSAKAATMEKLRLEVLARIKGK
jgi:hypothetical protein